MQNLAVENRSESSAEARSQCVCEFDEALFHSLAEEQVADGVEECVEVERCPANEQDRGDRGARADGQRRDGDRNGADDEGRRADDEHRDHHDAVDGRVVADVEEPVVGGEVAAADLDAMRAEQAGHGRR